MNKAVDQYIAKARPFAQPILAELRDRVHRFCPECTEELKWSFPHFMYQGKILCSMASFTQHCSFTFWLGSMMQSPWLKREGMGHLGKIASLEALPDVITFGTLIQEAMNLTDAGMVIQKHKNVPEAPIESELLMKTLANHPKALTHFEAFSPGKQKEYHLWIIEAKTPATAQKRLNTALEYISEGKSLNWKYQKK